MRARLFELVSKAIDEALAEVPANAREALDRAMMDNFPGFLLAGNGQDPYNDELNQLSGLETYTPPPATADPVGFEVNDLEEVHDNIVAMSLPREEVLNQAPKKRGRPKGSKGKAKKAKAPKAAKASSEQILAEIAEERAPVLEALANGAAEPPAEAPPA